MTAAPTQVACQCSPVETVTEDEYQTIVRISERVRREAEDYYRSEPGVVPPMVGLCKVLSLDLVHGMKSEGLSGRAIFGYYLDCEECYPDLVDYAGNPVDPTDDLEDWDRTWTHWWVVYKDLIIDLTADQFHPSTPGDYRIVITDLDDPDYSPERREADTWAAGRYGQA